MSTSQEKIALRFVSCGLFRVLLTMVLLFLFLFLFLFCVGAYAQGDHYIFQEEGYMRDAEYYNKQAVGYERDVEYFTCQHDYDKAQARTRMKWALEAMEKARRS